MTRVPTIEEIGGMIGDAIALNQYTPALAEAIRALYDELQRLRAEVIGTKMAWGLTLAAEQEAEGDRP